MSFEGLWPPSGSLSERMFIMCSYLWSLLVQASFPDMFLSIWGSEALAEVTLSLNTHLHLLLYFTAFKRV